MNILKKFSSYGKHLGAGRPQSEFCYIKQTKNKGRGVFARSKITKGTIFEVCPIIPLPDNDPIFSISEKSMLENYYLAWEDGVAIGLGYASLYNHSENPNAERIDLLGRNCVCYKSLSDILPNEEITVKYRCEPWWEK